VKKDERGLGTSNGGYLYLVENNDNVIMTETIKSLYPKVAYADQGTTI
jgi:hypothetical protein